MLGRTHGTGARLRSALPLLLLVVVGLAAAAPARAEVHLTLTDLNDDQRVVDPQFKWDPIPRAVRYEVEVNPSSDWAVGSRVCCDDKAIGTSLSPVKLLPNNTYYWRVRAFFAGGDAGEWLGLPTTGEVVLAWDPVPGASSYELKLAPYELLGGFCNWTSPLGPTFTTATTAWTPLGTSSTGSPVGNAHPGVTVGGALQPGTTYCVRARARSDRDAKNGEIVSDWTQIGGLGHAAFTYEATSLPPCHATSMPAAAYHHEPSRTVATRAGPVRAGERVHPVSGERAAGIRLAPTWRVHVRHAAPTGPRPARRGAPPVHVW